MLIICKLAMGKLRLWLVGVLNVLIVALEAVFMPCGLRLSAFVLILLHIAP